MPKTSSHFWWLPTTLSIVLSTLGIIALARHAVVTWSLSAPLALAMDAYSATVQLLVGWAHPYLQSAVTWLGSLIGWRPTLYPHWRDLFMLSALFLTAFARGARSAQGDNTAEWWVMTAALAIPLLVAWLWAATSTLDTADGRASLVMRAIANSW